MASDGWKTIEEREGGTKCVEIEERQVSRIVDLPAPASEAVGSGPGRDANPCWGFVDLTLKLKLG